MNLWEISAIDHHAHNILTPEVANKYPYVASFTEGYNSDIINNHAPHTLFYHRSIRDIAELFNCEPDATAIVQTRQKLGLETITQICFSESKLSAIFLDDGFLASDILPWQWHQKFVPVKRLLRLEYLAETLMVEENNFAEFLAKFCAAINPLSFNIIGLKSIVAYRTGLKIEFTNFELAKASFERLKQLDPNQRNRLEDKILIDFLLSQALDIAAKYQIPIQFHTGFGDPDLDLRLANPLHLRPILEQEKWRDVPIILLHAAYPFTREAGYLASVYPQVYLDFGLAIPFLSIAGMKSSLRQLLELAPTTKLMYSSDAHNIPELYYLGAKWGREILAQVLEEAISNRDLTARQAENIATQILTKNASRLYYKQ